MTRGESLDDGAAQFPNSETNAMFDFTLNAWFILFLISLGILSFTLARNITTGKALALGLGAAWKDQLAKWKAQL
jgi:hypothetical protein